MLGGSGKRLIRDLAWFVLVIAWALLLFHLRFAFGGRHVFRFHFPDASFAAWIALAAALISLPLHLNDYWRHEPHFLARGLVLLGAVTVLVSTSACIVLAPDALYELLTEYAGGVVARITTVIGIATSALLTFELTNESLRRFSSASRGSFSFGALIAASLACALLLSSADSLAYFITGRPLVSDLWQPELMPENASPTEDSSQKKPDGNKNDPGIDVDKVGNKVGS